MSKQLTNQVTTKFPHKTVIHLYEDRGDESGWIVASAAEFFAGANTSENAQNIIDTSPAEFQTLEETLLDAVTTTGASASVNVINYNRHTFQIIASDGSPTIQARTSLDNTNWVVEASVTESDSIYLDGKTKYLSVNYLDGSGTVTAKLLSGR